MERYGIYRLQNAPGLFVLLQYPGVEQGETLVVAPLVPGAKVTGVDALTPEIQFAGETYLLGTHLLGAVRLKELGEQVGSALAYEYDISRALSRLFFGS